MELIATQLCKTCWTSPLVYASLGGQKEGWEITLFHYSYVRTIPFSSTKFISFQCCHMASHYLAWLHMILQVQSINSLAVHALLCQFLVCVPTSSACATNLILQLQECLQGEVVTLQRQLTWLQSHASLQDNINKDLMQEVLHLREAVACLSAVPPIES